MRKPPWIAGQLAPRTPRECRECDVEMVARAPKGEYSPPWAHWGNGFCRRCYSRRWRRARFGHAPASARWSCVDLLAEYEFWAAQGLTKRQVADRLGVKFTTLGRAIVRARARARRHAEAPTP